jgi:amino acid transporter
MTPLSGIRAGRNWHEVYLLALSAAVGVTGLASARRSDAVAASFSGLGQAGWYGGLLVGSLLGIAGIVLSSTRPRDRAGLLDGDELQRHLRRALTGLTLERAAMLLLTGLCVAYVLGAVSVSGVGKASAALGVAYVLAFALACTARARQIRLTLRRVRDQPPADPGGAG